MNNFNNTNPGDLGENEITREDMFVPNEQNLNAFENTEFGFLENDSGVQSDTAQDSLSEDPTTINMDFQKEEAEPVAINFNDEELTPPSPIYSLESDTDKESDIRQFNPTSLPDQKLDDPNTLESPF